MDIKILHRNADFYKSLGKGSNRYFDVLDENSHVFKRELEYKRALNAVKIDKIFAKPLVKCLDGHDDAIRSICLSTKNVVDVYTGSCNGKINIWNIFQNKLVSKINAHEGFVRSLCVSNDDKYLFSCGDDRTIKQWVIKHNMHIKDIEETEKTDKISGPNEIDEQNEIDYVGDYEMPYKLFRCKSIQNCIDTHYTEPLLISGGDTLVLWNYLRTEALASYNYSCEYIYNAKFNKAEKDIVGLTLSDNSIGLVDVRKKTPINKIFLKYRSNSLSWNNMNPKFFTVANEDTNLYTFDIRYLNRVFLIHKGFVNAVLDVDYSPAGNQFVACSYDKTIRLFESEATKSFDVYHTKRMQRVLSCKFSGDAKYVYSGSTDMCLRVWKAAASQSSGVKSIKEERSINYRNKLKEKYASLQEIRRIKDHHHVPGLIKSLSDKKRIMEQAKKRREVNVIKNSKNKEIKRQPEKTKIFITEPKTE